MHRLGHWALCAGLPVIIVLYAPLRPLALVMLLLPLYLHYLYLFSHFLLLLPFLQGRCAFASKVAHLRDPELRKLAEGLPLRAAKAKAPSTTERYSRAFQKFREWSACFEEVVCTSSYSLRSTGMSYARTREIVLQAFAELGYPRHLFGLHSLIIRAGGASAAANAGVGDRLFKRHGRWRSDRAKDGYIKDSLESLLSVSKSLHA